MNKQKKTYSQHNHSGFTIIELILYVGLMGVFIVAIASLFTSMYNVRERHARTTEVEQQGLQIMQTLGYIISGSSAVTIPIAGASGSELSVNTFLANNNPTAMQVTEGTLYVSKGGGQPVALTNDHIIVSDLTFYNRSLENTSGSVQVIFTLKYATNEDSLSIFAPEKTFQSAFTLPR